MLVAASHVDYVFAIRIAKEFRARERTEERNLGLFGDRSGALWTQGVRVQWDERGELAQVRLEEGPPREAEGSTRVAPPRQREGANVFTRAFRALFG